MLSDLLFKKWIIFQNNILLLLLGFISHLKDVWYNKNLSIKFL